MMKKTSPLLTTSTTTTTLVSKLTSLRRRLPARLVMINNTTATTTAISSPTAGTSLPHGLTRWSHFVCWTLANNKDYLFQVDNAVDKQILWTESSTVEGRAVVMENELNLAALRTDVTAASRGSAARSAASSSTSANGKFTGSSLQRVARPDVEIAFISRDALPPKRFVGEGEKKAKSTLDKEKLFGSAADRNPKEEIGKENKYQIADPSQVKVQVFTDADAICQLFILQRQLRYNVLGYLCLYCPFVGLRRMITFRVAEYLGNMYKLEKEENDRKLALRGGGGQASGQEKDHPVERAFLDRKWDMNRISEGKTRKVANNINDYLNE